MLFGALTVAPCFYGVWVNRCSEEKGKLISEGQETDHAMRLDEDDPAVWEDVRAFQKAQTPGSTRKALRLLDEKLQNWDSHPAGLITSILDVVGEHRINAGRTHLVRFLYIDDRLKGANFIKDTACLALGELGGAGAFQELQKLARQSSDEPLASIATALGALGDPRSIPLLEDLAMRPDAQLRARALSSLAKYCSPTSQDEVIRAMMDQDDDVRNGAVFWLSRCGGTRDAQVLMDRLEDPDPLVRMNAVKGLIRIGTSIACKKLNDLVQDPDLSVREIAADYARICGPH